MKRIQYVLKKIKRIWKHTPYEVRRILIISLAVFLAGNFVGNKMGHWSERKQSKKELAAVQKEVEQLKKEKDELVLAVNQEEEKTEVELPWNMVLVNWQNEMQEGYEPELAELQKNYYVDERILDAAKQMLADAQKEGLHVILCSAYRSVERQESLFNESMKEKIKDGMSYVEAYQETAKSIAVPGTSEHALGLALDLISNQYDELDEGQEDTKEAKWLAENCYKYGFILRYPPEKTAITGIIYEPWHYRYVGVEDATKITELGITLEEYLGEYYNQPERE